jgi:hypothetical protein
MTTQTVTPQRPVVSPERDSFWYLVHAEWTKFRTVRGWVIAVLITIVAIGAGAFLGSDVSGGCGGGHAAGSGASAAACPAQPTGPGGEPVQDVFYFAHQPVTGNGTITVQMTSLTGQFIVGTSDGGYQTAPGGLQPWSKAGIIIKQNTSQGSAYAAMMVTGSHGVRMQWDYVNDTPGPGKGAGEAGGVSASAPRWLRLARDGDTITGYDSADGTHWTRAGTATLPGADLHRSSRAVRRRHFYRELSGRLPRGRRAGQLRRHGHGRLPPYQAVLARYRMDGHQRRRRRPEQERRATARHAPPARQHDHRSG